MGGLNRLMTDKFGPGHPLGPHLSAMDPMKYGPAHPLGDGSLEHYIQGDVKPQTTGTPTEAVAPERGTAYLNNMANSVYPSQGAGMTNMKAMGGLGPMAKKQLLGG